MHAIKAIYDGTEFKPVQPIPVEGNYKVFIIFAEPMEKVVENKKEQKQTQRSDFIGSWKNSIWISEDFNEPLEEMKEYME